jgi:hypothetical protein
LFKPIKNWYTQKEEFSQYNVNNLELIYGVYI